MTTLSINVSLPEHLSVKTTSVRLLSVARENDYSVIPDELGAVRVYPPRSPKFEPLKYDSVEDVDELLTPDSIHFSLAFDHANPDSRIDVGVFRGDGNASGRVNLSVPQGAMWAEPNDEDFAVGKKHYQFAKHVHRELSADFTTATGDNDEQPQFQFGGADEKPLAKFESDG